MSPKKQQMEKDPIFDTKKKIYQVAVISDLHFGSKYANVGFLEKFIMECKNKQINTLLNIGDTVDGIDMWENQYKEVFLHSEYAYEEYANDHYPTGFSKSYFICLSSDTDVYTAQGWKTYNELVNGDNILSVNKNKELIFNPIKDIQIMDYSGDMIYAKSNRVDVLQTPDHMMYVSAAKNSKRRYVRALDVYNNRKPVYMTVSGILNRPEANISDSMIALCALVVTEGTYSKNGSIQIYQYDDTSAPIREVLRNSGVKWSEYSGHCERERVFYIYVEDGIRIRKYLPVNKLDISWLIQHLSYRQMVILHEWLIYGDGTYRNASKTSCDFYTNSKHLSEQFQLLSAFIGYRAKTVTRNRSIFGYPNKDFYEVKVSKRNYVRVHQDKVSVVKYNGIVFDLTTEMGNFMIRRNGCISFTGNCGNHDESLRKVCGNEYSFCEELSKIRKDLTYLQVKDKMCASIVLKGGLKVGMFHGNKSCSDVSGRNRDIKLRSKVLEFMSNEIDNDLILAGHCHKIHMLNFMGTKVIGVGCFQNTTPYLKNRGITNDVCGLIIRYQKKDDGGFLFVPEFIDEKSLVENNNGIN